MLRNLMFPLAVRKEKFRTKEIVRSIYIFKRGLKKKKKKPPEIKRRTCGHLESQGKAGTGSGLRRMELIWEQDSSDGLGLLQGAPCPKGAMLYPALWNETHRARHSNERAGTQGLLSQPASGEPSAAMGPKRSKELLSWQECRKTMLLCGTTLAHIV